jgi:hypothetical protein
VRIAAESTIAASEAALSEVAASSGNERLILPHNLRHLAAGGEAALTQAILSWAQSNPEGILETYTETPEQMEGLVRRLPGLTAALCSRRASGIDGESIFTALRKVALDRLRQLQGRNPKDAYRGPSAEIVCADHLGLDSPYLLYQPDLSGAAGLRSREKFRELAHWLLRKTIPDVFWAELDLHESSNAIGSMLYEVFKNTDEHALLNIEGNVLDISIRAIKTNYHAIRTDNLNAIVRDFPPLAKYCASLKRLGNDDRMQLFEISVLDSGPGFAATWRGQGYDQMDLHEEEAATRACFGSGSAKRQDRFGEGLPHVLRLLNRQRGFLRLRTGRLSFFIDFSEQTDGEAPQDALELIDPPAGAGMALVAGSLLSILIPLRRKS